MKSNKNFQRWCAWSGLPANLLMFIALLTMSFFPPISPNLSAQEVVNLYLEHLTGIRIGGLLMLFATMFVAPFCAVLYLQIRRLEGNDRPVAAIGQLAAGIGNMMFFVLPGVFFVIAAYRPDSAPIDLTAALNDIAWFMLMFVWTPGAMQAFLCGTAILQHGSATSNYPRWVGFFSIWMAILMATSSMIPFFKTGPFAWDGLIGFWIPVTVFGNWFIVMLWATLKSISTEPDDNPIVRERAANLNPAAT